MSFLKSLRRFYMGFLTLIPAPSKGWFIPYRYASTVSPPNRYPALEPVFKSAESDFRVFLDEIDSYSTDLLAIGSDPPPQPRWEQGWFPRLDAAAAYTMVRKHQPRRIVEIGSGHSTRFFARAVQDGKFNCELISIDPEPRANLVGLDVVQIRSTCQRADDAIFSTLESGDFLFIDSSHILMPGSDVDYFLNNIWHIICSDVIVHIHDVTLPDGYPAAWNWRGYNEQSAIAPLISGACARLLFSSNYVMTRMLDDFYSSSVCNRPMMQGALDTSLWFLKK